MSEIDDILDTDLFVSFNHTFKAVRVIDNKLIPTTWKLKAEVVYDEEQIGEEYDFLTQTAFAKIRYWFDQIVDGSILMSRDNEWAQRAFISETGQRSVTNHLVILPDDPSDDILGEVLQSKMNALANESLTFGAIELEADDASGLSFLFTGYGELNLPSMEEWVGEHTFFTKPWWMRDDASTIDVVPAPDADLTKLPAFAYSLDFIAEAFRPDDAPTAHIVRPEFRPAVIKGGKDAE